MKRINLLPPEQKARASRERGLLYIIVALVALVVVLGAVYFQQRGQVSSKQDELVSLQAQSAAVQAQIEALQPYAEIEANRTAMTETTKAIYNSRVNWSTIFEQVSLVIPENVRLDTMNCVVPAAMLPGAAADADASAGTSSSSADVTFSGITYTPDDVATFMTRLGLIPQLTNIQLTSSARTATSESSDSTSSDYRWQFTITAQLRAYLTSPPATTLTEATQ